MKSQENKQLSPNRLCLTAGFMRRAIIALGVGLALLCLAASSALAGGQDGGGGGVLQCVQPHFQPMFKPVMRILHGKVKLIGFSMTKPKSVLPDHRQYELLDLWEAETGRFAFSHQKLDIPFDNTTPVRIQIQMAMRKLETNLPQFYRYVIVYLPSILKTVPIPKGNYVLPPDDTGLSYLPDGCRLRGLGYYEDSNNPALPEGEIGHLNYDPAVFYKLPLVDRAAFFMHEAIYKAFRVYYHQNNSWDTRRLVGFLFSTQQNFVWNDVITNRYSLSSR